MTTSVAWGFLGAGNIAKHALAPSVHAATGAHLQAVAARSADRAVALGPSGAVYGDYEAILEDPSVDAVYISLANDQHAPWTVRALEAGKHVLCEKPLGLDSAEVEAMVGTAERTGRLLVEATWNRWHPRTRRAEALVRAGILGQVSEVTTGFVVNGAPADNYRFRPNGGGALYDVGCYAIVAAMWATGGAEATVEWASARVNDHGVDLETQARFRLGGATVLLECAIDRPAAQWISVTGTDGSIDFPDDAIMSRNAPSSLTVVDAKGSRVEAFPPVDPYVLMVEHVSAAIRGDACYLPPATQSAQMTAILERIQRVASAP